MAFSDAKVQIEQSQIKTYKVVKSTGQGKQKSKAKKPRAETIPLQPKSQVVSPERLLNISSQK